MKHSKQLVPIISLSLAVMVTGLTSLCEEASPAQVTAESKYPGLFSSVLRFAILDSMPKGELLISGKMKITQEQLDAEIGIAPVSVREQLKNNPFFALEQMAARQLLAVEARNWAASKKLDAKGMKDGDIIRKYLTDLTAAISVSTEEARKFYDSNLGMFGGAKFEQIQTQLKGHLLNSKTQSFLKTHIDSLGKRMVIKTSDTWTKAQYDKALDNPVDRARHSGKPSLIDFGATGCVPCDMMAPILEALRGEYAGLINVEFVNVRVNQILGARYGISSIPVQVFFDKDGREVYRHVGFFARDKILERLNEMGAIK